MTDKKIKSIECKFVTYVPSALNETDDLCIVKEIINYEDGTSKPNIRKLKNYQRDFYVTKDAFRNHKDKKESESIKKLQCFRSNDRQLLQRAAKALGHGFNARNIKQLARSPYLYGTDVTSPVILKNKYMTKYPDAESANTVAVLDIETNMFSKEKEILSIAVTCGKKCYLAVTRDFIKDMDDPIKRINDAMHKYLGDTFKEREIDLKIDIKETPGQCVIGAMAFAHEIKPDYMTVWNIDFDVNKMLDACKAEGLNAASIFSDPSIPPEYQFYNYVKAPTTKGTASKKPSPVPWHERLNMFYTASSFQWIDAMVLYVLIRKAKGQLPSYKLDDILNLEIKRGKLKFTEADGLVEGQWHEFMQRNYKAEYLAYNIFDCIGIELLDEKTKDISLTINGLIGFSEIKNFTSTPTQLADDLHFVYIDEFNEVICSKSDRMEHELDKHVISMAGHIITLATHLNEENGIKAFHDFEKLRTLIRRYVADLDVKSAYPYAQMIENISKATTRRELVKIEGVSEKERRMIGYNLTGGRVNAVEYCTTVHKVPHLIEMPEYLRQIRELEEIHDKLVDLEKAA